MTTTHAVCVGSQPWALDAYRRLLPNVFALVRGCRADELAARLRPHRPRYVFFLHWSAYVLPSVFRHYECVNFHCTPLPYGRGGGPVENLILRGHDETVVTAHRMVEEVDAGPVYARSAPVSLAGTKPEILARFAGPVADLIRWIAEREPAPVPQAGPVVRFERLPPAVAEALWAGRRRPEPLDGLRRRLGAPLGAEREAAGRVGLPAGSDA